MFVLFELLRTDEICLHHSCSFPLPKSFSRLCFCEKWQTRVSRELVQPLLNSSGFLLQGCGKQTLCLSPLAKSRAQPQLVPRQQQKHQDALGYIRGSCVSGIPGWIVPGLCVESCVNYLCLSRLISTGILGSQSPAENVAALLLATC